MAKNPENYFRKLLLIFGNLAKPQRKDQNPTFFSKMAQRKEASVAAVSGKREHTRGDGSPGYSMQRFLETP